MFDKDTCDMKIQNHLAEIECSCPKYDMLLYYCQKDPFQLIDLSDAEPHLQILHHYQVLTHIIRPKHHNQRISTQGSNLDIAKLYCPWRIVSKNLFAYSSRRRSSQSRRLKANTMPITILSPQPAAQRPLAAARLVPDSDSDSDGGADIEGDISMGGTRGEQVDDDGLIDEILTPGTLITDNPQWMR